MRTLSTLLAIILISLIPHVVEGQNQEGQSLPKFLRVKKEVIGLNQAQLEDLLGQPSSKKQGGCRVPVNAQNGYALGDAWTYELNDELNRANLQLCLVKGIAVASVRRLTTHNEGVLYRTEQETLSIRLVLELLKDGNSGGGSAPLPRSKGDLII